MLVGLAVLFLVSAPLLAAVAVHLIDAAGLREIRAGAALRQIPATVVQSTPYGQAGLDGLGGAALVEVRWRAPSGRARTGLLEVAQGARAGARVTIWVTRHGQLADAPLSRVDLTERMALAAFTVVFGLAAALSMVFAAVRLAANRRRMADWARAWAATSTRWSQSR